MGFFNWFKPGKTRLVFFRPTLYLSMRYDCHINVECCASPKATKYLFKYVTKGSDRAIVMTEVCANCEQPRDEISEFQDLRSIGSSEAAWKLLSFPIADRYPAVIALRVHLKDQQQIIFDEETEIEALETQRETELTAFFKFNSESSQDPQSQPKYVDMPKSHVYNKKKKEWTVRKKADVVMCNRESAFYQSCCRRSLLSLHASS